MQLKRTSTTGARINYALKHYKITKSKLAEISGVDNAIISRACSGDSSLSEKNLIKITEALKVNPAWLLGYGSDDFNPVWSNKI